MRKRLRTVMFGIGLMILLAQPAFAEELGQANITPDMTMQEIRSNPVMQQSGLFLYGSFGEGTQWTRSRLENQTLQEYAWGQTVPETTAALNLAVQNVKDGVQVTWQVYSPEETEVDPSLGCVQLFYFPGSDPDGKYAIVMGGNALTINGTFGEGLPTAWELHEKGYTVFVLRYRAWTDLGDNAPLQDLGNAVNFITACGTAPGAAGGLRDRCLLVRRAGRGHICQPEARLRSLWCPEAGRTDSGVPDR